MIGAAVACMVSAAFGFMIAAVFNGETYDKGFDDGWRQRGIFDKHEEQNTTHGKWIVHDRGVTCWYKCDQCGEAGDKEDRYCRHCGAEMTDSEI